MPPAAPSRRRAWIRKALAIAVAAVVLLVLIELHGAVVRQGLRFIGAGSNFPTVLAVRDGCGHEFWVPLALRGLQDGKAKPLDAECEAAAGALGLLPQRHAGVLFVNGTALEPVHPVGRAAWFHGVRLQPGSNLLTLHEADTPLLYPLPVRSTNELPIWLIPGDLGEHGGASGGAGLSDLMAYASPQSVLVSAAVRTEAAAPARDALTASPGARTLELVRGASGDVEVRARACVAATQALAQRARRGALGGPQFVALAFQAAVFGRARPADDPAWRLLPSATLDAADAAAPCQELHVNYTVPDGQVILPWTGDFLASDGDRLTMEGFAGRLVMMIRQPDRTDGARMIWLGGPTREPDSMAMATRPPAGVASAPAASGGTRTPTGPEEVLPQDLWSPKTSRASTAEARREGLLNALSDLRHLLPRAWLATLWGLAAAAPVALILWALAAWPPQPANARLVRTRAALVALLAFLTAFALQPLLLQAARFVLGSLNPLRLFGLPLGLREIGGDLSAPMALCVVLLVLPLLRGAMLPASRAGHRWLAALAGVASLLMVVAALAVLSLSQMVVMPEIARDLLDQLPRAWLPVNDVTLEQDATALALALLFGAWLLLGLGLFWAAVYAFFRVAVPGAPVAGAALAAGLLLFLLPLSHAAADAAGVAMASTAAHGNWGFIAPALQVSDPARWLPAIFSGAFVLVAVTILLRALREVAAAMLDDAQAVGLRRMMRVPVLLLAALVIVWPMVDDIWSEAASIHAVVYRLMSMFLAFGALLALLAPWAAAQELDRAQRSATPAQRFRLPEAMLGLMCAAFAGYLTLWNREPVAVAVLMVTGWLVIRQALLAPADADGSRAATAAPSVGQVQTQPGPGAGLAQRLVEHLGESRLLRARRSALEKLFAEGKLSMSALLTQRVELDKVQRRVDERLGMSPGDAKRRLFEHGPGPAPLNNGIRGALAGLVVAAALQLLMPFDLASIAGGKGSAGWSTLAAKIIVDPRYQVVSTGLQDSRLLVFVGELLNAISIWAIAGFIFGYLFHRIRGRDGFVRAALFGVGVAIPYLLSLALTAPPGGVPVAAVARVVPLCVFLLLVGTLVFDGATLRRESVSVAKLPEIYGLKTSVGYLSFAGALAGIQPLLDLLGWVLQ